jgi:NCAIR mutase (PurE)-related protein
VTGETILEMLQRVRDGGLRPEEAMERLANLPYEEAGFAKIDHHRSLRNGLPEVIYAAGKTPAQVGEIFFRMAAMGGAVLATRADEAAYTEVKALVPEAQYHPVARIVELRQARSANHGTGLLAVLCAGTSDLPVAEEAAVTAEVMGADVRRIYDVGVAGLHRLLAHREEIREAEVVIVCRYGRRTAQCCGGNGGSTCDRRTHKRRLRGGIWGRRCFAGDAEFMLPQRNRGEYR